jgi:uncharacterized lipoprotein YmbA
VRSSEDFRLDVSGNDWWGEPLDAMMGRVLTQELTQRLPGSTVFKFDRNEIAGDRLGWA